MSPSKPGPVPRLPLHRGATLAMAVCGFAAIIATGAALADERLIFLATGLWALTIVLLPVAMTRDYDVFSIWSFAALSVLVGVVVRGACLSLGYPDAARLDQLYFLGHEPRFFFGPAQLLLLGLGMLASGYVAGDPIVESRTWSVDTRRLRWCCGAILAISAAATVLFVQRTGGWESGDWSGKRTVIPDLDLAGAGYQSHGGLRFLASLAIFGHVLALAAAIGRRSGAKLWWLLALLLLVVASVVPFHASLRTTVALQFCLPAAMLYYSGRRFSLWATVAAGLALLVAIHLMTALRPVADDRDADLGVPTVAKLFDAAVLNRNQIDLPKTAHIVAAVPEELPLEYGRTILRWVLAPIPRSLWPDKPVIPPGPVVGHTLYGQRVAGVPPSLVAELYWNFHWPGVIIGAFGLGIFLRRVQARFQAARGGDPMGAALFVAGPMILGFEAVGSSIGSGLFRAGLHTLVMLALLMVVRERRREIAPS
jgi:hypothetical protein